MCDTLLNSEHNWKIPIFFLGREWQVPHEMLSFEIIISRSTSCDTLYIACDFNEILSQLKISDFREGEGGTLRNYTIR